MDIIVCIKQVPDTTDIKIDPKNNTLIRDGVPSIINPFDMYAIEEGLRLKEKNGIGKVTVISMGPPQVEDALRETIAMGVDESILISDIKFAGSDTLATSYTLAQSIKYLGSFDLIICGKQAIDGDTAQVGPGISEFLMIPQVTYVKEIVKIKEGSLQVLRMNDFGYELVEVSMPALITVVKDINEPRLPSLKGKMKARKYKPRVITSEDIDVDKTKLGLDGSPTTVVKIFAPEIKTEGEIFEGEPEELAGQLFSKLKEMKIV